MRSLSNNLVNINMSRSESRGLIIGTNSSKDNTKKNAIFAGNNSNDNSIAFNLKKKRAQKEAMKIVTDAYEGDKVVTDEISSRKGRVNEVYDEISQYAEQIDKLNKNKENLKEAYQLTDEMIANGDVPKEYKEEVLGIDKELDEWNRLVEKGRNEAAANNKAVESIKIESCKQHNMVDATKQADVIMDEARQEIIDTVKQQAIDKIDDSIEEKVEEGKKAAEEKEEKEEKVEEKSKEESDNDKLQENTSEIIGEDIKVNVDKSLDSIKDKMKLLEEDIKGITVDTQL